MQLAPRHIQRGGLRGAGDNQPQSPGAVIAPGLRAHGEGVPRAQEGLGTTVMGAVTVFNLGRPYGRGARGPHRQPEPALLSALDILPAARGGHTPLDAEGKGTVHRSHEGQAWSLKLGRGGQGAAWGFPGPPRHAARSGFLSSGTFLISLVSRMHAHSHIRTHTHSHTHAHTHPPGLAAAAAAIKHPGTCSGSRRALAGRLMSNCSSAGVALKGPARAGCRGCARHPQNEEGSGCRPACHL